MESTHFASLYPPTTRVSQIERILQFAKEGNSSQVIGLPGVGRTNILELLAYNNDIRTHHLKDISKWFHFVLVNFSEIRNRPLLDATKFLFLSLIDSLRERGMEQEHDKAQAIFKESISFHDELVLFQGLKQLIDFLAIEKELTIVFLFDRFEEYIPQLTPDFFSNLRVLRNRAKYRFSVVFSLNRPLDDLLEPQLFADFYEFVADHLVYLPIHDPEGLSFRIAYLEKVAEKKIPQKTINDVTTLTAGHGKLTRLCLETLLSNTEAMTYDQEKLQIFLLSQKTVGGALQEIWEALRPSEQHALLSSQIEPASYLEAVGLTDNGSLCIPLFNTFLTQHNKVHRTTNDTILFDVQTNEIKKRDVVISDELTSAEYRLLVFLLAHQDSIINRDDIVHAVWQDPSTAGVTDQAIDQLIFRLRRKIENDPNNPKHILTIKGRGFRFLP